MNNFSWCLTMEDVRLEIKKMAIEIENEMRRKEEQGCFKDEKSVYWLINKLKEERIEVDECIENDNIFKFINEESLHEIIMLMIIRNRLYKQLE